MQATHRYDRVELHRQPYRVEVVRDQYDADGATATVALASAIVKGGILIATVTLRAVRLRFLARITCPRSGVVGCAVMRCHCMRMRGIRPGGIRVDLMHGRLNVGHVNWHREARTFKKKDSDNEQPQFETTN